MGEKLDFLVVGAGPAGAVFASRAAERGYRVAVVEAVRPGWKVCGGAIPAVYEEQVGRVPREAVVAEIRRFRVYLDGELLWEREGPIWGYLLDKRRFLESMLEGVEVYTGRVFDFSRFTVPGLDLRWDRLVVAAGPLAPGYRGDRIYAVQGVYRGAFDPETIEIHFDSRLVGYYWVFSVDERTARIGVGGYGEPREFLSMLRVFVGRLRAEQVEQPKGSYINIGGADPETVKGDGRVVIGEAAGYVYPVTGEGIRPAALSALYTLDVLEGKGDGRRRLGELAKSINVQRRLLDFVKNATPEGRARFLRRMGGELAMRVALGEMPAYARVLSLLPSRIAGLLSKLLGR